METSIMCQSNLVIDSLYEGRLMGLYNGIKFCRPFISNKEIVNIMRQISELSEREFNYYINKLKVDKE